jgi:drug/metabolite transporter (DMT)-like permease
VFYLIAVSIIWSASFGIFKMTLSSLDPSLVSLLRLSLALILFLPLFRPGKIPAKAKLIFFLIGMLEYGVMQLLLSYSFQYLNAWQVALMTLFTPIYIVAIDGIWKRRIDWVFLLCALLTVTGAAIAMFYKGCVPPRSITGCLLVQGADISFALGILIYRRARLKYVTAKDSELYALPFMGGVLLTLAGTLFSGGFAGVAAISHLQWWSLVYMGLVSSGLCLFWWNLGATKVCTGVLAVLSNIKVPMAVAVSLFLFGEQAGAWMRLLIGAAIMITAVSIVQHRARKIA